MSGFPQVQPDKPLAFPPCRHNAMPAQICSAAIVILVAAVLLFATSPAPSVADTLHGKADRIVTRAAGPRSRSGWLRVIIRLSGKPTPREVSRLKRLGVQPYRSLPIIDSIAARVPIRNLVRLAVLTLVKRISSDSIVSKCDEFTVGSSGADRAYGQYHLDGSGVGVAVVDSGVNLAADLNNKKASRIVADVSFVQSGRKKCSPADECGHGTHVAGIIAGNGDGSTGASYFRTFFGIARNANIINVKVLDTYGQGYVSDMISAVAWCISAKKKLNLRVMNLSLGHAVAESYSTDPLCQAVEQAWKAGIVVVCAAGNSGRQNSTQIAGGENEGWGTAYGSIQSPANDPYVITVGAMKSTNGARDSDQIATYSSRGPTRLDFVLKPDITAPGNRIISLDAPQTYLSNTYSTWNMVLWNEFCLKYNAPDSSKYFRLSGTSMAAPVVSGAVALMLQSDPSLTPDTIKARLMLSADKWHASDGSADPCTFGAGYLDIPSALACTMVATQSALSPVLRQQSDGTVTIGQSTIYEPKAIWGGAVTNLKAIWGSDAITGGNVLTASKAIWGRTVFVDNRIWSIGSGGADLSLTAINGE